MADTLTANASTPTTAIKAARFIAEHRPKNSSRNRHEEVESCFAEAEIRMRALMTLLGADPAQVDSFSIEQVVAWCGNGQLTDNSACSQELREYLQIAKSELLFRYLQTCLLKNFEKSDFVLQDII